MNLTFISKDRSLCLKGIALFFMVFLHLFNQVGNLEGCFSLFSVNGLPLANFLSRGCSPVGLYLFVSGYGLYFMHRKHSGGGILRLLKLYILYWIILAVFVTIGSFMRPEEYPGTLLDVLLNATAFRTTYYGEAWFLFPYILLALTSSFVFASIDRWNVKRVLPVVFVLNYGAMFMISRYYNAFFNFHYAVYHVVLYFDCLLPFLIGALFCKFADMESPAWLARVFSLPQPLLVGMLLVLFMINCYISSAAFGPFFLVAFVTLFINIHWYSWFLECCRFLGKFSTTVWLVHTWFCYYLFKDFIYGFHYPLLILAVEFALSIATGFVIQKLVNMVYRGKFSN